MSRGCFWDKDYYFNSKSFVFRLLSIEQAARAQSRPFRDELAELSDKGSAKQQHLT
jgi:hypothetical protein